MAVSRARLHHRGVVRVDSPIPFAPTKSATYSKHLAQTPGAFFFVVVEMRGHRNKLLR
jgi:hypothetical protein